MPKIICPHSPLRSREGRAASLDAGGTEAVMPYGCPARIVASETDKAHILDTNLYSFGNLRVVIRMEKNGVLKVFVIDQEETELVYEAVIT